MDWTVKDPKEANHNPEVVVNGTPGKRPVLVTATAGTPFTIDAAGTQDPDGHRLAYRWFFYSEAGTGIPGGTRRGGSGGSDWRRRRSRRKWHPVRACGRSARTASTRDAQW